MSLTISMRFATALDSLFDRVTKVRLLRTLLLAPTRRWTGRELAKAAGVSSAQAARDLRVLLGAGIVDFDVHGRSFVWRLNRENALYPELVQLFNREAGLRSDLVHDISVIFRTAPIRRARLFGSVARGDEEQDSDIDLLLEIKSANQRPLIEDAVAKARDRVWKKFGNPLAPLVYVGSRANRPRSGALAAAIERDGMEVPGVGTA